MQRQKAVTVVGAGIAGTWQALLFSEAGYDVTLLEAGGASLEQAAAYWAGGMLAPDCEAESAEPGVVHLGRRSLDLWRAHLPDVSANGSLVVAHARDRADFERFARLASRYERIDARRLAELEPALAGRFREALFFPNEAHVEPRQVLPALHRRLRAAGATIHFNRPAEPKDIAGAVIDCRGLAARDVFPDLRGVRGEAIAVETGEVTLSRPVRLLHPRWPLYVVPRPNGRFLIGATAIESEDRGAVTVRSALELLTAAYSLHPAFGEARIVEFGTGLRPAFPDHAPRIRVDGEKIAVNGLYRHGFLLAPALAELTLNYVQHGTRNNEVMRWS
jgi:glycine oxidase